MTEAEDNPEGSAPDLLGFFMCKRTGDMAGMRAIVNGDIRKLTESMRLVIEANRKLEGDLSASRSGDLVKFADLTSLLQQTSKMATLTSELANYVNHLLDEGERLDAESDGWREQAEKHHDDCVRLVELVEHLRADPGAVGRLNAFLDAGGELL